MPTQLVNVVFDTARPRAVAEFWAAFLGWQVVVDLSGEVGVRAPAWEGTDFDLTFVPVPEPKSGKNRLHLDLASGTPAAQSSIVDRAIGLGAQHADIGQGGAELPWIVLADPAGNEFCVLEPRPEYTSTGVLAAVVVDAHDPPRLAEFWSEVIGWVVARRETDVAGLRPPTGRGPWLEFVRNGEPKRGKNRVRLDVAPVARTAATGDQQAVEVERLVRLGARVADPEPRDVPWRLLEDPEGNEFRVLSPR
ncbi:VOC family protein [Amycolatopsis anabasis]|uniref:VOC family protein n=1 Tax=Amycolatopsis anabasis TaxID=1840409 RepID=UPI00131E5ABC|nr:VOC family protein [Amycolatopsis anabasis]